MGIRVALCQTQSVLGDVGENLNRIMSVISQTNADMYIFPELFLTGYGAEYDALGEDVHNSVERIRLWCLEKDIAVVVGAPSYDTNGLKNSLLFITGDDMVKYDKLYPAKFGLYSEKSFIRGKGPVLGKFRDLRFGLSICYDIFFPEIYRNYALSCADVNICVAASLAQSRPYFDRILPARSLENVMYTILVNSTGRYDEDNIFHGHSRLIGPLGNTITEAEEGEDITCVYIDRDVVTNARKERRHLDDLRNDITWTPDIF